MSLVTFYGLSVLLHAYIGLRIAPLLPAPAAWALAAVLALSAAMLPMGMVARRFARPPASDRLQAAGLFALGLFSSLFVATLLRDVLLLVLDVVAAANRSGAWAWLPDLQRDTAYAVPLLAAAVTLFGFLNARRTAQVKTVEVPVKGLPRALQGFTIVQITDVHVGPTIRRPYIERIVQKVNRLQPDAVAITGDLVDGSVPELRDHVAPLSGLQARHGSFFVTGNHEYYCDFGALPWMAELERLGIRVLHNEHVVLEHEAAKLVLAGVPDYTAGHFHEDHRSDPKQAIDGAPGDAGARVLLAHQPRSARAAAEAGFDLQISGHTHGGQFWPWIHFVRLQQPFTAGLHRLDELWVYVSRGTGYWGPPKRFGAPSEITRIRLIQA